MGRASSTRASLLASCRDCRGYSSFLVHCRCNIYMPCSMDFSEYSVVSGKLGNLMALCSTVLGDAWPHVSQETFR